MRNRANGETSYRPEYAEKLDALDLLESELAINCVWPTTHITPEELGTGG